MNNKGQMGMSMIWGLVFLVLVILVFTAFLPVIKETINNSRGQDALNCAQTGAINQCNNSASVSCYNSSIATETTGCLIMDLYIPFIVIIVLIGAVGMILSGRMGSQQPQQYGAQPGY